MKERNTHANTMEIEGYDSPWTLHACLREEDAEILLFWGGLKNKLISQHYHDDIIIIYRLSIYHQLYYQQYNKIRNATLTMDSVLRQ